MSTERKDTKLQTDQTNKPAENYVAVATSADSRATRKLIAGSLKRMQARGPKDGYPS